MKIVIGADIVPTENNEELFINGDALSLVGKEIKEQLDSADYRIFNLELALADKDSPIKKVGPNLRAKTQTVNGIKALGTDLLCVANNHILDHGYDGFKSTLDTLNKAGIAHVGGGYDKAQASAPYYFEKAGKKIGVYACCEHEFSWIDDNGYGANGFDALDSLDEIQNAKSNCDYLIVLYHGGKEHYQYPSPYLRKVCKKIVDKGANLVVCQHTHCVGAEEDYHDGKIVYGQGNFIFAKNLGGVETWLQGMLITVDIDKDVSYSYLPYEVKDKGIIVSENEEILNGLKRRSNEIKQDGFVETKFDELAEETLKERYVQHLVGEPASDGFIKDYGLLLSHFAECEVHKESIITALRKINKIGKYNKNN